MEYHGEQLLVQVVYRMFRHVQLKRTTAFMLIFFFSGFPPKLPTRAFHSSEESIYGAGNDLQQQQTQLSKENSIVCYLTLTMHNMT